MLVLLGLFIPKDSRGQSEEIDFQTWTDFTYTYPIKNRVNIGGDLGVRGLISQNDWNQFYLRPTFQYFFNRTIQVAGGVAVFTTLSDTLEKLMLYSNNFTANQIFLAIGASVYGPPATLEKGAAAVSGYMKNFLGIADGDIVEGSGLSRKNKVSAAMLDNILHRFYPRRNLLKHGREELFKTGTLSDVSTRIGYLTGKKTYRYVIMINSPGTNASRVVEEIRRALKNKR